MPHTASVSRHAHCGLREADCRRCNNVLWIRGAEDGKEVTMTG